MRPQSLILPAIFACSTACNKDKKVDAEARARVVFENSTSALLLADPEADVPNYLGLTVTYVNIAKSDRGNGTITNMGGILYINPDCIKSSDEIAAEVDGAPEGAVIGDADVDGCGTEAGEGVTKIATTKIDFAQGSTAVNQQLNAQNRPINLGHVDEDEEVAVELDRAGIAFRREWETTKNATWTYDKTGVKDQSFRFVQNELYIKLDPPLILGKNDRVRVILKYDLEGTIKHGVNLEEKTIRSSITQPGAADSCTGTVGQADYTCLFMPTFTATFEKY